MRVLPCLFLAARAVAQTAAAPSFEVADVKISAPGGNPNADFLPGGKLTVQYVTMKEMIALAWDLREDYVTAGPAWLDFEHYDIVAKAAHAATDAELRQMMQRLLAERFKLAAHLEKRDMPVYTLTVGKKGKLQPSTADAAVKPSCKLETPQQRKDGLILRTWACKSLTVGDFTERLPNIAAAYVDRPVVDLTGLEGRYDFTLEWAPRRGGRGPGNGNAPPPVSAEPPEPDGPTLFNAVQNQLGLKLDSRKHPMDVLVIDAVERVPTDN